MIMRYSSLEEKQIILVKYRYIKNKYEIKYVNYTVYP